MKIILKSLVRNGSTIASEATVLFDCFESDVEKSISRNTLSNYLDILRDIYILIEDEVFDINYHSSKKVGKSNKRYLVDLSLSCYLIGLNTKSLINDLKTFGFMFEALVEMDLRV